MKTAFRLIVNRMKYLARWFRMHIQTRWLQITLPGFSASGPVAFGPRVRIRITDGGRLHLGYGVTLEEGVLLHVKHGCLEIGNRVFVGRYSEMVARDAIRIGDDCQIAPFVVIRDANHRIDSHRPIRQQGFETRPVVLGRDCWLGSHVAITAGTKLNDGAVIGANAVVTGNIPANAIAVGVPARIIKQRP